MTHTLSVLVENKPGVLVRIAGLFARRNFNIESLAVGPTEHEEISRITIVVNCEEHPLEQVTKQLNKLINVLKIVELEPGSTVQRELILIKVRADAESRSRVLVAVDHDGDAGDLLVLGGPDGEGVDVETPPCEQPGDPDQDARLVLHQHGQGVLRHAAAPPLASVRSGTLCPFIRKLLPSRAPCRART